MFGRTAPPGLLQWDTVDRNNARISMHGVGVLSAEQLEPLALQTRAADSEETRQQLFASLYDELRRIARRELRRSGPDVTLGATTLLHEVYLDLQGRSNLLFPDRARFFAYASRAMRGLIIDYARSRQALKRGAAFEIAPLPTDLPEQAVDCAELERLSDAIDRLAATEPRLAQVVDLKYFGGFSFADIAGMLGVSERTVQRNWEKARIFLYRCLSDPQAA
jgi:RNA polymerase sigma factor (TIGR02999 family)